MEDDEDNKKKPNNSNISNQNLNLIETEDYQKYKVNDITISSISYDNIEEKMNQLIEIKKTDNLKFEEIKNEAKQNEIETQEEKEKKQQEKKEKEEIKENKIKQGYIRLNTFINIKNKKIFINNLKKKK